MELLLKVTALCLCAATVVQLLARTSGEYAFLLLLAAVLTALTLLFSSLDEAAKLGEELVELTGIAPALFVPLLKVMAVAVVESVGAALCRDAGKSSLAMVLEMAGAVCALVCAEPLVRAVVTMLREWV